MTKIERTFKKELKQAYMDYKDGCGYHDYAIMVELGQKLFGWSDRQVEINETLWRKEWNKLNRI